MPVVDRFIYLRHSKVWTDQEDGTTKIDLPFSQHQAPHSWGFLFVGGWVDLGDKRGDIHEKIKDVCDACIVFFDTNWWLFNFT